MARREKNASKKPDAPPIDWRESYGIENPKQRAFLSALAITGILSHAFKLAGICKQTHYNWLALKNEKPTDQQLRYREAVEDAIEQAGDGLEYRVWRMANDEKKPNLTAAIFLLNGMRPQKYRQKITAEHTGVGGGPIETSSKVEILNLDELRKPERLGELTTLIRSQGLEKNFPELFKGSEDGAPAPTNGNGNGNGNGRH